MTPAEVMEQVEAFGWRLERGRELIAWQVAHLLAPYSKEPITVDELLGREPSSSWIELDEDGAEQLREILKGAGNA